MGRVACTGMGCGLGGMSGNLGTFWLIVMVLAVAERESRIYIYKFRKTLLVMSMRFYKTLAGYKRVD